MIPARKRSWFARLFAALASRRLRSAFSRCAIRGHARVRELARRHPLVFVVNHTSWWDGLVLSFLSERILACDAYVLMDAANLRRLRFFRLCGAFGIDLDGRRDAVAGLRYAQSLLQQPMRAVWMFPQGAERPAHEALSFRPGAARLAELVPEALVVPMAVRYVFAETERPHLWIAFGDALGRDAPTPAKVRAQESTVAELLATIDGLLGQTRDAWAEAGFEPQWDERLQDDWPTRWLDALAGWWLGWIDRRDVRTQLASGKADRRALPSDDRAG